MAAAHHLLVQGRFVAPLVWVRAGALQVQQRVRVRAPQAPVMAQTDWAAAPQQLAMVGALLVWVRAQLSLGTAHCPYWVGRGVAPLELEKVRVPQGLVKAQRGWAEAPQKLGMVEAPWEQQMVKGGAPQQLVTARRGWAVALQQQWLV